MAAMREFLRRLFPPLKVRKKLIGSILALSIYGIAVAFVISAEQIPAVEWGAEVTIINGVVLGFLISFRNNHAYDRWWEARKLWGQLINENRNLCLKVKTLAGIEDEDRAAVGHLIIVFCHLLKDHLRSRRGLDEPHQGPCPPENSSEHPSAVALLIYERVARWQTDRRLDGWTLLWLDNHIKALMDICGACERIRNTPLSSSYRALLRHGIAIYLAIAPLYLIDEVGLKPFPVFLLAAYFLLGIEFVAEEIEEPFGVGGDNLPLEKYCGTIESSVWEILGRNPELNSSSGVASLQG
jgi:ion channel-forming bestrophin family protein